MNLIFLTINLANVVLPVPAVPANDSTNLLFGKLILETGDSIQISSDSATNVKFIGSILETLN